MGFQKWAVRKLNAIPGGSGADRGIDGVLRFKDPRDQEVRRIIISVKGGKAQSSHLRDLRGTMVRENAVIGVLVTAKAPSPHMTAEVASSGYVQTSWGRHPVMQILTIEDLFDGKRINYPRAEGVEATFKTPRRSKRTPLAVEQELFSDPLAGTPLSREAAKTKKSVRKLEKQQPKRPTIGRGSVRPPRPRIRDRKR